MFKRVLFSCIVLFSCAANVSVAAEPTDNQCLAVALFRECSGCSARGQKAIEEVIVNRAEHDKKTICQVVKSSAFPWSSSQKSWKPDEIMLDILFRTRTMLPVVGKSVWYFNNEPFKSYGKFAVKIEGHYFYYRV